MKTAVNSRRVARLALRVCVIAAGFALAGAPNALARWGGGGVGGGGFHGGARMGSIVAASANPGRRVTSPPMTIHQAARAAIPGSIPVVRAATRESIRATRRAAIAVPKINPETPTTHIRHLRHREVALVHTTRIRVSPTHGRCRSRTVSTWS
jgi:hypothetical protein